MNFKQIRELAINLYKQEKTEEEINKLCGVPLTKEMISSWIQEDEEMQRGKKLAKLFKKMQQLKKSEMTAKNRETLIQETQQIAFEILKIEENNEIALNELVRCFSLQKQYDLGRVYGNKILNNNPKNIFALYNMAKLEMIAQNYEKAMEYNAQLLKIEPQNMQGNTQKSVIEERRKQAQLEEQERKRQKEIEEKEKQKQVEIEQRVKQLEKSENQVLEEIKQENVTIEEKQEEFANQEERYTKENKEVYMQQLQTMFYEGKLNSQNIESVKQELYRYPNQVESAIFISELYYLITENEERGIEELDICLENTESLQQKEKNQLQEKREDFLNRIKIKEQMEENQIKAKEQEKETKNKQRQYMTEITTRLNEGTIQKEEVEGIVANLEKCLDRNKAVFLIIKIQEAVFGKAKALKAIQKYSRINNITEQEREVIVKMVASIKQENRSTKDYTEKLSNRTKIRKKREAYKKQISTKKIKDFIIDGMSVKEVFEKMSNENFASLKSIAKIRSSMLQKNELLRAKQQEDIRLAEEFLRENYSIKQVYELFDYNIGKNELIALRKNIKEREAK